MKKGKENYRVLPILFKIALGIVIAIFILFYLFGNLFFVVEEEKIPEEEAREIAERKGLEVLEVGSWGDYSFIKVKTEERELEMGEIWGDISSGLMTLRRVWNSTIYGVIVQEKYGYDECTYTINGAFYRAYYNRGGWADFFELKRRLQESESCS